MICVCLCALFLPWLCALCVISAHDSCVLCVCVGVCVHFCVRVYVHSVYVLCRWAGLEQFV
jgi:hypothetical protein